MKLPTWILKKGVKIPLIIVGSLLVLLLLINFLAPPIVHRYAEKHSKELCHRTVTLDKLRMNIFTGMVRVEGLKALEENDKDEMLSFDKLEVRISLLRLLGKEVRLNKIEMVRPNISVWQKDSIFNFTDIIEFYTKDDKEDNDTTPSGWSVDLRKISIDNGTVIYRDLVRESKFDLRDFSVYVPRLYFGGDRSDIGVKFKLSNGGDLAFKMDYGMNDESYKLSVDINRMAISAFRPYVASFLNVDALDGNLSTHMVLNGNLNHIFEIVAAGNASLSNLKLSVPKEGQLLAFDNLSVGVDEIDLVNNKFYFNTIELDGANINCALYNDYNSFSKLFVDDSNSEESSTEPSSSESSSSPAMDLKAKSILVKNGSFIVADHTLEQPFEFPVKSINIEANDFSLHNVFKAKLNAVAGQGGELAAHWEGTLNGFENHKINLTLRNFKLSDISPYCVHFTAYPISTGILSFTSRDIIKNNKLDSRNNIDIYNCKVEKKIKGIKPEYNIPMKAALYILTDRKGKIAISLPMSGDVSDPNFSLKKIIWKTIGNFLVKVITAPTDFLAQALGSNDNTFSDLKMDLTDKSISSENYDKLNAMVEVLKSKSEMKIAIQQTIDNEENQKLYANLYNTSDEQAINEAVKKSVERRYQMLQQYFEVQGIPAANIEIKEVAYGKTAKGKANFSFAVSVPMEENPADFETIE